MQINVIKVILNGRFLLKILILLILLAQEFLKYEIEKYLSSSI